MVPWCAFGPIDQVAQALPKVALRLPVARMVAPTRCGAGSLSHRPQGAGLCETNSQRVVLENTLRHIIESKYPSLGVTQSVRSKI